MARLMYETRGRVLRTSASGKAVLFRADDSDEEVWLPVSQIDIHDDDRDPEIKNIVMPEWLAIEKELV